MTRAAKIIRISEFGITSDLFNVHRLHPTINNNRQPINCAPKCSAVSLETCMCRAQTYRGLSATNRRVCAEGRESLAVVYIAVCGGPNNRGEASRESRWGSTRRDVLQIERWRPFSASAAGEPREECHKLQVELRRHVTNFYSYHTVWCMCVCVWWRKDSSSSYPSKQQINQQQQ